MRLGRSANKGDAIAPAGLCTSHFTESGNQDFRYANLMSKEKATPQKILSQIRYSFFNLSFQELGDMHAGCAECRVPEVGATFMERKQ